MPVAFLNKNLHPPHIPSSASTAGAAAGARAAAGFGSTRLVGTFSRAGAGACACTDCTAAAAAAACATAKLGQPLCCGQPLWQARCLIHLINEYHVGQAVLLIPGQHSIQLLLAPDGTQ